jgi:hypothetical protein
MSDLRERIAAALAKATPGPWRHEPGIGYVLADEDRMTVAETRGWGRLTGTGGGLGLSYEEAEAVMRANAELIALAPEMAAALLAAEPVSVPFAQTPGPQPDAVLTTYPLDGETVEWLNAPLGPHPSEPVSAEPREPDGVAYFVPQGDGAAPLWQACPVCNGTGLLTRPPHVPGDVTTWLGGGATSYQCPTCLGRRIINVLSGHPPAASAATTFTQPTPVRIEPEVREPDGWCVLNEAGEIVVGIGLNFSRHPRRLRVPDGCREVSVYFGTPPAASAPVRDDALPRWKPDVQIDRRTLEVAERDDALREAHRHFRWAYALLLELAKEELAKANAEVAGTRNWPGGQQWNELVGSSHAVFLRKARERAGIPHDEFLAVVRGEEYGEDAEKIYDAALRAPAPEVDVADQWQEYERLLDLAISKANARPLNAFVLRALEDAARLDRLEQAGGSLCPVEGNIAPPGSWAVEDDSGVSMGVGVRAALRTAYPDAARAAEEAR